GGEDVLVYDEPDDGFFLGVHVSESREYIIIHAGHHASSESHVIPAPTPEAAPTLFAARADDVLYSITHWNGGWYILTNADGAVDFKIMRAELGRTERSAWRDFIPYQEGRYILSMEATKEHLVRAERTNALPRVVVRHSSGDEHTIAFDE